MNVPTLTLANGNKIPQLGFGVWELKDGEEVEQAVKAALLAGYRSIDTAAIYGNEKGVGKAIAESGIDRAELFITTKLWNKDQAYGAALKAFDVSLEKLGLDYVDLYLIHWPCPGMGKTGEAWRALEKLYADGRAKAIGVSNFQPEHFNLLMEAKVMPMVDQVELHPRLQQKELREYVAADNIIIEAWSPLFSGGDLLQDKVLIAIAQKHQKTVAQVILRWHIQTGHVVIPKSVTPERIIENISIFDFELDEDDMGKIAGLESGAHVFDYDLSLIS